jgi:hypothetical protein
MQTYQFFLILLLVQSLSCLSVLKKKVKSSQGSGQIAVTVDNTITDIQINGISITLAYGGEDNWQVAKIYNANINEGDTVEIFGLNVGGQAGILATVQYVDAEGNTRTNSTGPLWTCGGVVPYTQGANGVGPWGSFSAISSDAVWIWNSAAQVNPDSTSCKVVLPKTERKIQTNINVTVDNTLTDIQVNGVSVSLAEAENTLDYTVTKHITVSLQEGDVVEIFGENTGGSEGILATLSYVDSAGNLQYVSTGAQWSCSGSPAVTQGANGVSPWGTLADIDSSAEWIWTTLNNAAGDSTSCKITLGGAGEETTVPSNDWSAVLTWGNKAQDIDIWAVLPDGSKVYYRKKTSGQVTLDADDRVEYGPETLSFSEITSGAYQIWVHVYSKEVGIAGSEAEVDVANGDVVYPFQAPEGDESLRWWHVCNINAETREVETVNTLAARI